MRTGKPDQEYNSLSSVAFAFSCLKRGLGTGWGAASGISLIFTMAGGAVAWKWPQMGEVANLWMWLVPLVALVLLMFMGTLHAAFSMWRERDQLANSKETRLTEEIGRLKAELEAVKREHSSAASAADKKSLAHTQMNKLKQELDHLIQKKRGSFPLSGGADQLRATQRRHNQETKALLAQWLKDATQAAAEVSLEKLLPPLADLQAITLESTRPDDWEADRFAQRLHKSVDAILERLR